MMINYWIDWAAMRLMILALAFTCVRFYVRNLLLALFIAIIITAIISVALFFALKKRKHKKTLNAEQRKKQEYYMQQLTYSSQKSNVTFFTNLLCAKNKVDQVGDYLIINENTLLQIRISTEKLSAANLLDQIHAAKEHGIARLCVFTRGTEKEVGQIISLFPEFSIKICTDNYIYELLTKYNCYPATVLKPQTNKARIVLPIIFGKDRVKGYLSAALFLLTAGIFLPYAPYYNTASALLLLAAIISQKSPFKPSAPQEETYFQ